MKTAIACSAILVVGILRMKTGRGPVENLITGLQHMRAGWLWTVREAVPAVWRVRGRYWEQLGEVRRG